MNDQEAAWLHVWLNRVLDAQQDRDWEKIPH